MTEKLRQITEYVYNHAELFDRFELMYIRQYIQEVQEGRYDLFLPDVIRELFDYFHAITDDQDIYSGFLTLLQKEFPIEDRDIIEVGGGIFPCLGKKISLLQNYGSITVYDPRLSVYERGNSHLHLVRKEFSRYDDVGSANLIIGFMPCKGAEDLVDSATSNEIDFMVALCEGGPHGDIYDYFESDDEWIDSMLYRADRGIENHHMGTLGIQYLDEYEDPYPVIYNKRK